MDKNPLRVAINEIACSECIQ